MSVVIDVLANPNEIIVPFEPNPGQVWGFAVAEVQDWIRSRGDD